jgi:hypothetical protein
LLSCSCRLRRDAVKAVEDDSIESSQAEVITVSQEEEWTNQCGESFRGICAIGLLTSSSVPGVLTGMDVMTAAMKGMKKVGASFRFLTIDAACHSEFAETFGIHAHELPTVVIYSPSKRRYQILKGTFNEVTYAILYIPLSFHRILSFEVITHT